MYNAIQMDRSVLKSDLILLLAAIIWGFCFVAQRLGMEHMGPFTFTALRFSLGTIFLAFFILIKHKKQFWSFKKKEIVMGCIVGAMMFAATAFQQVGITYTTATKSGFITSLYVILVPIFGFLFWEQKISRWTLLGSILAVVGLYLLTVPSDLKPNYGDILTFVCALFWAFHVLTIGKFSPRMNSLKLALVQFSFCTVLSIVVALIIETTTIHMIYLSSISLLYSGIISIGVAFTLQIVGQKYSPPSHAAIIMSLEAVFAAVGGWFMLNEGFTPRTMLGCGLMLFGMLISHAKLKPALY